MKYRKLRIGWSVSWVLAAVLVIVLWVRSYWWVDVANYTPINTTTVSIILREGNLQVFDFREQGRHLGMSPQSGWVLRNNYHGRVSEVRIFRGLVWDDNYLALPAWTFLLVSAGLSGAPLLPGRFSLRTLLIAMTLLSVGLGWIVYAMRN